MGTGRDDFTNGTIRKAAGRVGYHCSFPGCTNTTIGASMESTNKCSVTGVAAHICAAAKGGPRYDENMTTAERRSVENCIWLCETHARLIDTDVKTYTVDVLHRWKAEAELAASKALADGDYFSEYYKGNGDNLAVLKQLFDDMVVDGQFDLMLVMLNQYKTKLSEQYEEFVLRYKIIYSVYCDRAQLGRLLDAYCSLRCKNGIDVLAELFLSFHLVDELGKVFEFCQSEPLKEYAEKALSGELAKLFIAPIGSTQTVEIPAGLNDVILKYITNYIIRSKMLGAMDVTGAKYEVFSDEFYYRAVSAAYELACATIYGKGNFEDIFNSPECSYIKANINKIILLDVSLQEYIWGNFLSFLAEKPEQFEAYYKLCPSSLKVVNEIEKAYYIYKINSDPSSIDGNELLTYASNSGEYTILCVYLSCIERATAIEFLDEHGFLYKESCAFLKLKLDLIEDVKVEEACDFLNKYREIYKDDFTFHALSAKYSTSNNSLDEEIEWLNENKYKIRSYDAFEYIRILRDRQRWGDLAEFSRLHLPNECTFAIAGCLAESNDDTFVKVSYDLYQKLVDLGWKRKDLYYNLGVVQRKQGFFEEAKKSFQKEFDLYANLTSLMALMQLRYSLNEYLIDEYFDQTKRCIDAEAQNLVAAIYLKRCNYSDARKYFLRSLLLKDTDNPSINGFCQTTAHLSAKNTEKIGEDVCCVLKNGNRILQIAIHETDVLAGIKSPKNFAGYEHYSVQDTRISTLLFAGLGSTVELNDETFEVVEVTSINDAFVRFFFSTISTHKGVTTIKGGSPEDLFEQVVGLLKKSSEKLNKQIDTYNQLEVRSPLSVLATVTGKGKLKTSEFLAFQNQSKIRNNPNMIGCKEDDCVFILSYETIVYLAHLKIDSAVLGGLDLACSSQVKNQLLNDINEELSEITDDSQKGTMFYENGRLAILERTLDVRRARHAFLVRLKTFLESIRSINDVMLHFVGESELKDHIEKVFKNKELYCENTSLGVTQSMPNAILVTDDQFLYALANTEHIPNTGVTGLLSQSNMDWRKLLSASKMLKDMNFGNYLPVHLYKRIVDQMLTFEADCENASTEIQEWIISDTEGDATKDHEDIIVALFRGVVEQELAYLNPGNFLMDIVLNIWEKRNPGFIQECIVKALGPSRDEQ